jgi:hypothetical protein
MVLGGQRHAPAALYSMERIPDTHWIGYWVGPRAGLDAKAGRKSFSPPAGDRTPVVQSVVSHYTELPRLQTYPCLDQDSGHVCYKFNIIIIYMDLAF